MDQKLIQKTVREWLDIKEWSDPHAITFTIKQSLSVMSSKKIIRVKLDKCEVANNIRHFINVLSRSLYGNMGKRFGKKLKVIPIIEGGAVKRIHAHLMIDRPADRVSRAEFEKKIKTAWIDTMWGLKVMHIETGADAGYINYITKFADKNSVMDSIDLANLHI